MIDTIISGAQTGADRGGLLAAHDLGISRGGWAPAGWRSEDGVIPDWFRSGMVLAHSSAYPVRTRQNVLESGGTLVVTLGSLGADSGSYLTAKLARKFGRPCIHMTIDQLSVSTGMAIVRGWIEGRNITTLNVAGSRESREPGIQQATRIALVAIIRPSGAGVR